MSSLPHQITDTLWSLWTELGVPGTTRQHEHTSIDPEVLIAWTPHLARDEPRLLGLAFDWCASHSQRIHATRLPSLARTLPDAGRDALARFNKALQAHGVKWRPAKGRSDLTVDRGVMALPMERPALARFRLRALAGPTTRADVLAELLARSPKFAPVRQLCSPGVGRRSVERILADLLAAGWAEFHEDEGRRVFRLCDPKPLERAVGCKGLAWPDLHNRFAFFAEALGLHQAPSSVRAARVSAAKSLDRFRSLARALGLAPPSVAPSDADIRDALLEWSAQATKQVT